jgi:5-formyltetrahydrofolate cyclo-ligase
MTETQENIIQEKKALRRKIRQLRRNISPVENQEWSSIIQKRLFSLPNYQKARSIFYYVSLPEEVNTHPMIIQSLTEGKKVIVPVSLLQEKDLLLSEIHHFPEEFYSSHYKILEPKPEFIRPFAKEQLDLVILPGLAFDQQGQRLGFGKGYFDHFLQNLPKQIPRIGLAFDFQILPQIPVTDTDQPVQMLITPTQTIYCP